MEFWWFPGTQGPESGGASSLEEYGRGELDPETGLYEWYELPAELQPGTEQTQVNWNQILDRWSLVEADLHEQYGIDLSSGVLRKRSWRWLRTRIYGLLSANTRLNRSLSSK